LKQKFFIGSHKGITFLAAIWIPNMRKEDRSLARYPEFEAYRNRTKLFTPFLI
jgi:hypothetical protein